METTIHTYTTPLETATVVAQLIADRVIKKCELNQHLNIAISGGTTPKLLFEVLASEYKSSISWQSVRFFWVDERCVPPSHSESNYKMTYEALLQAVSIPPQNIFRMHGEEKPEVEATRYEAMLRTELPIVNNYPQFDLILLGMGDDGHTASIFTSQMELLTSPKAVAIGTHPTSGQQRITLTGKTINNASEIFFVITGKTKASVLRKIIKHEHGCDHYPAAHIHNPNNSVSFCLDEDAATEL